MNGLLVGLLAFLVAFGAMLLFFNDLENRRKRREEIDLLRRNIKAQADVHARKYESYTTKTYPMAFSPDFKGMGSIAATHELHCFTDVNPTPEKIEAYKARVDWWNKNRLPLLQQRDRGQVVHNPMKSPVLTLLFRKDGVINPITVCQSARHIQCDDRRKVLEIVEEDKEFFENTGPYAQSGFAPMAVCRIKVEATAHGVDGVPQTAKEAANFPRSYFECHIRVHKTGSDQLAEQKNLPPITHQEQEMLERLTGKLTLQFGFPVPLSLNVAKGHQRFINARFYGVGLQEIVVMLQQIRDAVEADGIFMAKEHLQILEYVWFDTAKQIDAGWIDFTDKEFDEFVQSLRIDVVQKEKDE